MENMVSGHFKLDTWGLYVPDLGSRERLKTLPQLPQKEGELESLDNGWPVTLAQW